MHEAILHFSLHLGKMKREGSHQEDGNGQTSFSVELCRLDYYYIVIVVTIVILLTQAVQYDFKALAE